MEHTVTDDINGGADTEVEPRAEMQALEDENQALKAGTPDGSDKCGTSRYIKCGASRHLPLGACLFLSLFAVCSRGCCIPGHT